MDWIQFCKDFYSATFIPISYYRWPQQFIWANPPALNHAPASSDVMYQKIKFSKNPDYFITDSYAYLGIVNIDSSDSKMDYLIIGPLFSIPLTDDIIHNFMHELNINDEASPDTRQTLINTPTVSYHQFLSLLAFLNMCINGVSIDINEHFKFREKAEIIDTISARYSNEMYDKRENNNFHNTYDLEQTILNYIERGNVLRLQELLSRKNQNYDLSSGILSSNLLRNKRNLFVSMVTLSTRAAIAGGLDVEQAYQLSDLYIQECEKTIFPDKIDQLSYSMIIDFATRVSRQQLPIGGMSKEVFQCVQFISKHTNEPIHIDDVAAHIGKSRSYVIHKFQEELGFGIGAFINRCKLEEAKNLLTYTDKSLSEISNYLCFSSQAYFQNVFKKSYHVTPLQYRKSTKKMYES